MKRALVTGGSGDIGQAICLALAQAGHYVYVHANSRLEKAEGVVEQIQMQGGQACAICFDVTNQMATHDALEQVLSDGAIQILVNNAGIHDDAIMAGMDKAQWQRVIDVNLNGFYHVTQPLLLPMMQTRWGRVINISSIAGVMGNRGQANYAAAKAGLIGATKSLAIEMGSRGIAVNAVAPGIIASEMTEELGEVVLEEAKKRIPAKRLGTAEEVAAAVLFLASKEAGYISGQTIVVDGGMIG